MSPTEPKIKIGHIKEEPDIKCSEGNKNDFTFEAIDPIPNDNDALPADMEEQIENMMERSANKIQNGKEKQIHCSILGLGENTTISLKLPKTFCHTCFSM